VSKTPDIQRAMFNIESQIAVEAAVSAANSGKTVSFYSHEPALAAKEFLVNPFSPNDRERRDRTIAE
jgi:hypothetical protein